MCTPASCTCNAGDHDDRPGTTDGGGNGFDPTTTMGTTVDGAAAAAVHVDAPWLLQFVSVAIRMPYLIGHSPHPRVDRLPPSLRPELAAIWSLDMLEGCMIWH